MGKNSGIAKPEGGRRPSPIWLSEEFFDCKKSYYSYELYFTRPYHPLQICSQLARYLYSSLWKGIKKKANDQITKYRQENQCIFTLSLKILTKWQQIIRRN